MVISHLLAGMILQVGCPAGSDRFTIVNTKNYNKPGSIIWGMHSRRKTMESKPTTNNFEKLTMQPFRLHFCTNISSNHPELPFCRFSKNFTKKRREQKKTSFDCHFVGKSKKAKNQKKQQKNFLPCPFSSPKKPGVFFLFFPRGVKDLPFHSHNLEDGSGPQPGLGWIRGFHNHGDRFRPLRIGSTWEPLETAYINGFQIGVDPNHLVIGMILQVGYSVIPLINGRFMAYK